MNAILILAMILSFVSNCILAVMLRIIGQDRNLHRELHIHDRGKIVHFQNLSEARLEKIHYLNKKLCEARKNDHRDPKTGRFVKAPHNKGSRR